jgi:hypothetical protein
MKGNRIPRVLLILKEYNLGRTISMAKLMGM